MGNGRIFYGPFKNGKQHEVGKLTYGNSTFEVEFSEGTLLKDKKNKSPQRTNKNISQVQKSPVK